MNTPSSHLGPRQLRGLCAVGDILCPGDDHLPSFTATGCIEHVDRVLDYLPAADRADFAMLLGILGRLPRRCVPWMVCALFGAARLPGPPGNLFRMARFGLRGTVFSLYYSGATGDKHDGASPLDLLGYEVRVYTGDRRGDRN